MLLVAFGRWSVRYSACVQVRNPSGPPPGPTLCRARPRRKEELTSLGRTGSPFGHFVVAARKEGLAPAAADLSISQGEVWDRIARLSGKLGVSSPTGAFDEVYASRQADLDEWMRAFPAVEGQTGLLVLAFGRPVGLDVVGAQSLYARLHQRFLSGYLLDGLDSDAIGLARPSARRRGDTEQTDEARAAESATAREFMDRVMKADRVPAPTVGLGEYRVLADSVVGGELVENEWLGHLSAFPAR